jgi:ribokinase
MVCLVVGDTNADLSASLEAFPREGDDVAIQSLGFYSGGAGANVAVAFAKLGGLARLLSRVGKDPAAEFALHTARTFGVNLDFMQIDPLHPTGLCFAAISPHGERTFFSYRGANVALELPDFDVVFQDVRFLHLSGHALLEGKQRETALVLLEAAHRRGIRTSIDLCLPLLRKWPREMITLAHHLHIVFANSAELAHLGASLGLSGNSHDVLEDTLSALLDAGIPLVVAKRGASGSRVAHGASRIDIAPWPITPKDTTGAGDGFVAAFLFVLQQGGSPEIAAEIGNVVGALVAGNRGAAEACPDREQVVSALQARGCTKALDVFVGKAQDTTS